METNNKKQGTLVALCGAKGCGKTTLADLLCADRRVVCGQNEYHPGHINFPSNWKRVSFAGVLKDMLRAMGVGEKYLTTHKEEPIPNIPGNPTARRLMQTLGTEWGRDMIHQDIWTGVAMNEVREILQEGYNVVIDDMRFPNEAEAVESHGGIIVGIAREKEDGTLMGGDDDHQSESHFNNVQCDFSLLNFKSPEGLLEDFNAELERQENASS